MRSSLPLDNNLTEALSGLFASDGGSPAAIDHVTAVGGGSISRALLVESGERRCFVKLNAAERVDMFAAEADGLHALAACQALRVPRVIGHGVAGQQAYLALEYLPLHGLGNGAPAAAAGRALAALHRLGAARHGWPRDNYLGSTPQRNAEQASWPAFFASQRLQPQLELAAANGHSGTLRSSGERLSERLAALFVDHRPAASLLHGDLWSGNAALDESGTLALFDPAVHFGDRECDLAMSELFGGFPERFYAAYREAWPLADGYRPRRTLYQLYHILNHLNLFGGAYLRQAEAMIASLLAEIGG